MKKFVFILVVLAAFVGIYIESRIDSSHLEMSDIVLENIEALADDNEYVVGPIFTNWKTYRIECTMTIGFDYILKIEKTTTYWTDACGSGAGTCLSPAGC